MKYMWTRGLITDDIHYANSFIVTPVGLTSKK